jgi:hypothetical protein
LSTITFEDFTSKVIEVAARHGNPIIEGGESLFSPSSKGSISINLTWGGGPGIIMRTQTVTQVDGAQLHAIQIGINRGGTKTMSLAEFKPYIRTLEQIDAFCDEITALTFTTFLVPAETNALRS